MMLRLILAYENEQSTSKEEQNWLTIFAVEPRVLIHLHTETKTESAHPSPTPLFRTQTEIHIAKHFRSAPASPRGP
jgi:hypothetical protein